MSQSASGPVHSPPPLSTRGWGPTPPFSATAPVVLLTYRHSPDNLVAYVDTDEATVLLCDRYGGELQHQESHHVAACRYADACATIARYAGFSTFANDWEFVE